MTVHIDQGETGGGTRVNLSETVADYQPEHNPDAYSEVVSLVLGPYRSQKRVLLRIVSSASHIPAEENPPNVAD